MVHLVLDQLGEVGWKPNPMPAAPRLIFIAYGNTPAPLHPNHAIGNTETVIPDFEFFVAPPRDFRVDQGERSRAKIHDDDPLANPHLWRSHGAAETATLPELVERRVKTSELPGKIHIRPRDFGRLLFEKRIADCQDRKRLGSHYQVRRRLICIVRAELLSTLKKSALKRSITCSLMGMFLKIDASRPNVPGPATY